MVKAKKAKKSLVKQGLVAYLQQLPKDQLNALAHQQEQEKAQLELMSDDERRDYSWSCLSDLKTPEALMPPGFAEENPKAMRDEIDGLTKDILNRLYKRKKTGGRKRPDGLGSLLAHFNACEAELGEAKEWVQKRLPKWQEDSTSWHQLVRDSYSALANVEDDLIERLSPSPKLPKRIHDLMEEKDHEVSKLSHIALEIAARLCGCTPYRYTTRHLFGIKQTCATQSATDARQ